MSKKLRVSHFPQIPCNPFIVAVRSIEEAKKIFDVLANYDLFQYENRIKPDYRNTTILEYWDEEEKEWLEWHDKENNYTLDEYYRYVINQQADVIDEGYKFNTTEQTEYIKEIQKVSMFKLENLSKIKVEWKIPNSKLLAFNCEWTKDSANPFPFILRKSKYTNGYYIIEAIIFNNLETGRYYCCKVYKREEKDTSFMYPYSDWNIVKDKNNAADIIITTDEILKALDIGFEWIHIDETAEWFMNVHEDSSQPCWLK